MMLNEHEVTKNMLSTIRKANKLINEEEVIGQGDEPMQDDPTEEPNEEPSGEEPSGEMNGDSMQLEGSERDEELDKLKQAIAPRVKLDDNSPIIYPDDEEAIIRGEIDTIKFEMSVQNGLYITTNTLKINDSEVLEILKKLSGYYSVWRDEMPDKFPDYKKSNS